MTITPAEIAAVLEIIANQIISDDVYDLAGRYPSWFMDAANVIERLGER